MSMEKEQKKTRTECDLLGCVEVPENVLYGVQTMRGLENFPISKFRLCEYPLFIRGLAIVKLGAAVANHDMGCFRTSFSTPFRRPAVKSWRANSTNSSPWT